MLYYFPKTPKAGGSVVENADQPAPLTFWAAGAASTWSVVARFQAANVVVSFELVTAATQYCVPAVSATPFLNFTVARPQHSPNVGKLDAVPWASTVPGTPPLSEYRAISNASVPSI